MNKFFYFLAVLCLFTLGSCEKDTQPAPIDAGGGTRVLIDSGDGDGGGKSIDINNDGPIGGGDACSIPSEIAFRVYPNDYGCLTGHDTNITNSLTCVINPNYYPASFTYNEPPTLPGDLTIIDAFRYDGIHWSISGFIDDAAIQPATTFHSDETSSTYTYFESSNGYRYNVTISADFTHLPTGEIIRYTSSFCVSSDPNSCQIETEVHGNGGSGGTFVVAFMPYSDSNEGPP